MICPLIYCPRARGITQSDLNRLLDILLQVYFSIPVLEKKKYSSVKKIFCALNDYTSIIFLVSKICIELTGLAL